jgi:hypothetical protein
VIGRLILQAGGSTSGQLAVATVVLVVALFLLAIETHRQRFRDLPTELKQRARTRFGARAAATGETVRITADDPRPTIERRLRSVLTAQPQGMDHADGVGSDETTLTDAASAVRASIRSAWGDRLAGVPPLSIRLVEEAIPIAIFGSMAVFSIEAWRRWLSKGDGANLSAWVEEAQIVTADTLDLLVSLVTAFPYFQSIISLALAYAITVVSWVYGHPLVVATALLVLALGVYALRRRLGHTVREPFYESRWLAGLKLTAVLFVVWVVGIVPAKIGAELGFERWGGILGLAAAGTVGGVVAFRAGRRLGREFRARLRRDGLAATTFSIGWRAGAVAGIAAIPLVVVYAAVAILTGKAIGVIGALLSGSFTVQALVAAVVVGVGALLARDARDALDEVRTALRETASKAAIRGVVMQRALPVGLVGIGFLAALESGVPLVPAALVAILLGLVARGIAVLYLRAYQRARVTESRTRTASRVIATGYVLDDVDGALYYLEVNTIPLAARDRDRLIETAADVTGQLFEQGDADPTVEQAFADDLFRGIEDCAEMRAVIERDVDDQIRSAIVDGYRDRAGFGSGGDRDAAGSITEADLEAELDSYPPSVWRDRLRELRVQGVLRFTNGRYFYQGE